MFKYNVRIKTSFKAILYTTRELSPPLVKVRLSHWYNYHTFVRLLKIYVDFLRPLNKTDNHILDGRQTDRTSKLQGPWLQ